MKLKTWLVSTFSLASATAHNAIAALPTTAAPSRGATSGGYIELFQNYAYDVALVVGLILGTARFLIVASNAISVYGDIGKGRKQFSDLGGHLAAGVLLMVFTVYMLTEASSVL